MQYYHQGGVLDELPPLIFDKSTRDNKKFRESVLNAFENIALQQFRYNIEEFDDFYKMYDGSLSHKELKLMAPQFEHMADLLDKAELPSNVRHWDILGAIINTLVGKLIMMQDKFVATDTGEIAENEFLEQLNTQFRRSLEEVINNKIRLGLAEKGINPETMGNMGPEEQQQYLQMVEAEKRKIVSDQQQRLAETAKYKTQGVIWSEATLEKDKEELAFEKQYRELFKQYLLSGVCAKVVKIVYDTYKPFVWDSRSVFHSKDFGKEYLQDFQYAGRLHYQTPAQVIEEYGMYINPKVQKELLQGDETWKTLIDIQNPRAGFQSMLDKNFHQGFTVPYLGYDNMLFHKRIEELSGLPMGEIIAYDENHNLRAYTDYIPRDGLNTYFKWGAQYLEDRFMLSTQICQVTEVYFRAMEYVGWLTYPTEYGDYVTVEVTEDILPEFLAENNIKRTYKESYDDMVKEFKPDTLVWQLRPVVGWGVKISSGNKVDPIFIGVEPMEVQIKGANEYDVKLPVTGMVGRSLAKKISPWQEMFNYAWNQIRTLLEKELGMFFMMPVENIPSMFSENGDAREAFMDMRNYAKNVGLMPIATDAENVNRQFNQFATYNVSHGSEIQSRYQLANICKQEAYLAIGVNPMEGVQPQQYATNEGIKVSQEAMQQQIAYIYEDFNGFIKNDLIHHLSVAQYAQSNNMDKSLYYTKSDASIQWLKNVDPNLPLRRLGITVTDNNKKRKEIEAIRQFLIQQGNTMQMDSQEAIRLFTGDTMRELFSIAEEERALRQEREQIAHDRQMQQIEAQNQGKLQADQQAWLLQEETNKLERQNRLDVKTIDAIGRAADKDGNAEDFDMIIKTSDSLRADKKVQFDQEARLKEIEIRMEDNRLRMEQLLTSNELKRKDQQLKEKDINSKERIALYNKN